MIQYVTPAALLAHPRVRSGISSERVCNFFLHGAVKRARARAPLPAAVHAGKAKCGRVYLRHFSTFTRDGEEILVL